MRFLRRDLMVKPRETRVKVSTSDIGRSDNDLLVSATYENFLHHPSAAGSQYSHSHSHPVGGPREIETPRSFRFVLVVMCLKIELVWVFPILCFDMIDFATKGINRNSLE